jgi:arylsulfatase A-like enzyme/Tfp pilus assembly protein PilF
MEKPSLSSLSVKQKPFLVLIGYLVALGSTQPTLCAVSPARPGKPNVILITIDTLRADHLGCYGYRLPNSKNIDALSKEGSRFTTVVAQVPLTLPSHCSILTGTYPMFHHVRDNVGYRLDNSKTTLAEILKSQNYQTGAFIGAYILSSKFGLNQGFDIYDDRIETKGGPAGIVNLNEVERPAAEVIRRAIQWIERVSKVPFFVWIHLYDPHDPYNPPAPFARQFASRPYDGEIAYVDAEVGRFVSYLRSCNLYDRSVLVLTSDHGESFGEHREFTHGYFIYDTTLLVPLIIKPVGRPVQSVITQQVRSVDIVPTILQMLEVPIPSEVQGSGLLGLMLGKQHLLLDAYSETFYPTQFGWSQLRSLRRSNAKYIEAPKPELFDLGHDPEEMSNIVAQNQALASEMKNRLTETEHLYAVQRGETETPSAVSPEELEKLGALGYVGAPTHGSSASESKIQADPKDKLRMFQLISLAGQNAASGRCNIALRQLQKIIQWEPTMLPAHFLLGRCYYNEGQYEQARPAFEEVVKLNSQSLEALFFLAACDLYLKRLESAEAGFLKVLSIDEKYVAAHRFLAFLYQSRGQTEPALREYQRVIEITPQDQEAHFKLGFLLAGQSKFDEAIIHFRKAVELAPADAAGHFNLGVAYLKTDQSVLAQQELSQACKLDSRFCKN